MVGGMTTMTMMIYSASAPGGPSSVRSHATKAPAFQG